MSEYNEILKNNVNERNYHQFILDSKLKFIIGECNICFFEKALIGPFKVCSHQFCLLCYNEIFKKNKTYNCAFCRRDITSWIREIMLLEENYFNPKPTQKKTFTLKKSIACVSVLACISTLLFVSLPASSPILTSMMVVSLIL